MVNFRYWFKQGSYSLLNRIATVLFGFANLLLLVRVLPKAEVGDWILFTSVTSIVEIARNGFIRSPFIASLSGAAETEQKKIISASLSIHVMAGLVMCLVIYGLGMVLSDFWDSENLKYLFFVYIITSMLMVPLLQMEYILQWRMNFRGIFLVNLVRLSCLTTFLLVQYFLVRRPSLMELVYFQLFAVVLGIGMSCFLIDRNYLKGLSYKLGKGAKGALFHMGKYTVGTNISSMVIKNTDSWMIGRLLNSAMVAVYNPAIRIANIVEVPTLAIANLIFPQVNKKRLEGGDQGIRNIYLKSVSLILAMIIPATLVIYIFADPIVTFTLGENYQEAGDILRVTVFYTLIIPFNRQFGTIMDGIKKPKLNFYLLVIVAVLNVGLSYIFIRQFGAIGAAYGTVSAYLVVFVLNQFFLYRIFRINTLHVFMMIPHWYGFGIQKVKNLYRKQMS